MATTWCRMHEKWEFLLTSEEFSPRDKVSSSIVISICVLYWNPHLFLQPYCHVYHSFPFVISRWSCFTRHAEFCSLLPDKCGFKSRFYSGGLIRELYCFTHTFKLCLSSRVCLPFHVTFSLHRWRTDFNLVFYEIPGVWRACLVSVLFPPSQSNLSCTLNLSE